MNDLKRLFIAHCAELIYETVHWNGKELQTTESFIDIPVWKLYGFFHLSIEQQSPILFTGVPKLSRDLIVEVKEVWVNGMVVTFYIDFINRNKKSKNKRQILAVERKLDRMNPFLENVIEYEVKFYGDK